MNKNFWDHNLRYIKDYIRDIDQTSINPIQDGLSANLFGTGGADSAPPSVLSLWGPKGPKIDSPEKLWCIWGQQKKNWADRPKIGAVSPNSKFQPNGWSGRMAYFQENSRSRTKIDLTWSFLG